MESAEWMEYPISMIIREDGTGDNIVPENSPIFEYTDKGRIHIKQEWSKEQLGLKAQGALAPRRCTKKRGEHVKGILSDDGRQKAIL